MQLSLGRIFIRKRPSTSSGRDYSASVQILDSEAEEISLYAEYLDRQNAVAQKRDHQNVSMIFESQLIYNLKEWSTQSCRWSDYC